MEQKFVSQQGQVVLITLLVLSLATTVALSLIGRSTTDVRITGQIEESSRAFSAAEAGIEESLKTGVGSGGPQVLTPGTTYDVIVDSIGGASGVYQFPHKTLKGATETLWLVNHTDEDTIDETPTYTANTINVCWSSEATVPALVVTLLYKSGTAYKIAKGAYDPDNTRAPTNKFSGVTAASGGCGVANMYRQLINFTDFGINPASDTLIMLRMRPLYSDTLLAVNPGSNQLPTQGKRIESVGAITATGVTRKVIVYQQFRSPAGIFDNVIYSQTSF